jgi:hypothetical protein
MRPFGNIVPQETLSSRFRVSERLPGIAHGAGAGVGRGARGELAVELAEQGDAIGEAKLGAGGDQRGVLRRQRAVDHELAPGSVWNSAARLGSLTQSCAQASRPRNASAEYDESAMSRSKRAPR